MKFLFYYILRRFFVRLEYDSEKIVLTKGIIFRITTVLALSSAVKFTVKRSPLLRLFHAKEVTIFTLKSKLSLFLSENEQPPFLPKMPKHSVRPRFREILFGAFIDTRALAGIAFFTAILRRIGSIIGSSYFDNIISAFVTTAEKISETLLMIHVAVPKIAAFAAVFALCAWIFSFLIKLLRLSELCLSKRGKFIFVKSGIVTLYETALVQNTDAAVMRKTIICHFAGYAPVYYNRTMILPAASENNFERISEQLSGTAPETSVLVKTPFYRISGHITVPLWIFGISSALLVLFYLSEMRFARLLKTALYCSVFASGYISLCGMILMKNAASSFGEFRVKLSFRRGTAVYCADFSRDISKGYVLSQNIFQRSAHLCDYKAFIIGKRSFRSRQLPLKIPSDPPS